MGEIKSVGIVGFGVMGAAIGLNAAQAGYQIIYKELNDELVKEMYEKWIVGGLTKRLKKGKLNQSQMDEIMSNISGTSEYSDLAECDLVIEAAIEKVDLKRQIFSDLDRVVSKDTIIVSNTSSYMIESLMRDVSNKGRTAGLHYFFPANVNRLVEVIRHQDTSNDTYDMLMAFAEKNGKIAITVRDFPGFAINPIFISAYMVVDSFIDSQYNVATLEHITQEALGIRFGIPWVQNGSGIGTCYHAAVSMNKYLADSNVGYPPVPIQLKKQFESGKPFNLADGDLLEDHEAQKIVKERLLGAIFAISTHLIENKVVSITDLELGVRTSLAWPMGPFEMMNKLGMSETKRLIQIAVEAKDFRMPSKFKSDTLTPWSLDPS